VDWSALKSQGYVSDFAGVVDPGGKQQLETYCAAVEQTTGARIALVIVESLRNEPIDGVARAIFRGWGLGQRPGQNAVLLLVAEENRRDRIEVGAGLAAVLPDGEISAILRQTRPALARQQYAQAMMAAADEIGTRLARAQHKTLPARLPGRARPRLLDSVPWLLAAGALPLCIWLFRVLGQPPRRTRAGGGFGGGETDGW
jgi:uncharacterized protein